MIVDAVILARGGSKGIPRKNLLPFLGVPLVELSIRQAKNSSRLRNTYLSSDSDEILSKADKYDVIQIKRPSHLATDSARSEDAVIDLVKNNIKEKPDAILMIEPTAPLRMPTDIDQAVKSFIDQKADSLFSGAFLDDFLIWKKSSITGELESINYDYKVQGPRQERVPDIVENGAIYLFKVDSLITNSNRFGGKICHFKNHFWQSFEIDNIDDWSFVELIYKNYIKTLY
tara:strand:- start:10243 stop:10932 length:690 start_codon:yes stop_codon:yes gene_type:complete